MLPLLRDSVMLCSTCKKFHILPIRVLGLIHKQSSLNVLKGCDSPVIFPNQLSVNYALVMPLIHLKTLHYLCLCYGTIIIM